MSELAHNLDQEYWRPPEPQTATVVRSQPELCGRCDTEYVLGARFCYVCGAERDGEKSANSAGAIHWLNIRLIAQLLGLGVGPLIAFFVGIACMVAAVLTGLIYPATTLVEWQAVQTWRLEWLLSAVAALLTGILLKR
jgi:hypothetical protein